MPFRRLLSAAVLSACLALPAMPVQAASIAFTFDKPHTIVYFTVNRDGFTAMLGRFTDVDGKFTIDPDAPETAKVTTAIKTASVFTGYGPRDDHLRSPAFFNVQEFPEMTFASTHVQLTGDKTAKVTGNLTLLGITRPVTFDVTFNKLAVNRRSGKRMMGFSAVGTMKRSEFGMQYLQGMVGDVVTMHLEVLGDES